MRSIRSKFTRMTPGGRKLALRYLNKIREGEHDLFGDPELGDMLKMQHSNLAQYEQSGLHPVTGIMNDDRFKEFFKMAMQRWEIEKESEADERREVKEELFLVFIDLDNFKAVNDDVSYEAGDFVLREFAAYLQSFAESCGGYASHWGGDEYVVFAPTQGSAEEFPSGWENFLAAATLKAKEDDAFSEAEVAILNKVTVSLGGVKLSSNHVAQLKQDFEGTYTRLKANAASLMKADKKERKAGR